jgi:signal transduction histidine kinase
MAERKGLTLEAETEKPQKSFCTDRGLVHRILSNLVHNAIKFTEEGAVRVAAEIENAGARVAVSDTGIGIAPAFREHLYEPFKQESEGRARTHEGTGLGLALTKRMVDLLGGNIEVESVKGEGTTVVVSLPPAPPAEEREEAGLESEVT